MASAAFRGIAGELKSFSGLSKRIDDVEGELAARVHKLERYQDVIRTLFGFIVGALIAVVVRWASGLWYLSWK